MPGLDAVSKARAVEWRSTGTVELAGGVARAGDVLSDAGCVLPDRLGAVQPDCPRSNPPAVWPQRLVEHLETKDGSCKRAHTCPPHPHLHAQAPLSRVF